MRPMAAPDLHVFTSRKVTTVEEPVMSGVPEGLEGWIDRYLALAVTGVRSTGVADKITLHLARFVTFFRQMYGHDRLSACVRRAVVAWQTALRERGLAPATINNHLASLSAFTTWAQAQAPGLFPVGDPAKGIGELGVGPLEPRALRPAQAQSLKNLCDRLERFHQRRDRCHPVPSGAGRRAPGVWTSLAGSRPGLRVALHRAAPRRDRPPGPRSARPPTRLTRCARPIAPASRTSGAKGTASAPSSLRPARASLLTLQLMAALYCT